MKKTNKRRRRKKGKKSRKSYKDNDLLLVGTFGNIQVYDIERKDTVTSIPAHEHWVNNIAILPSRSKFLTISSDGFIKLWNLKLKCLHTFKGHKNLVECITIIDENRFATGGADRKIKIWSISKKKCIKTISGHGDKLCALTLLQNEQIASSSHDQTIRIWDSVSGKCLRTILPKDWVSCLFYVKDRNTLLGGCNDGSICVYPLDSHPKKKPSLLEGHRELVTCLDRLNDEEIVSAGIDGTIRIWNLQLMNCIKIIRGHKKRIGGLAVLPDYQIATCSDDQTYKIWDLDEEKCLRIIKNDEDYEISSVAFLENNPGKKEQEERLNYLCLTDETDICFKFGADRQIPIFKCFLTQSDLNLEGVKEITMKLTKLQISRETLLRILLGMNYRIERKQYVDLYCFFKKLRMSWHMYGICQKLNKVHHPSYLLSLFERTVQKLEGKRDASQTEGLSNSRFLEDSVFGGGFKSALALHLFNMMKKNHSEEIENTKEYWKVLKRLGYHQQFLSHEIHNIESHKDFQFDFSSSIMSSSSPSSSKRTKNKRKKKKNRKSSSSSPRRDSSISFSSVHQSLEDILIDDENETRIIPPVTTFKYFFEQNLKHECFEQKKYANFVLKSNQKTKFFVHKEILIFRSHYFYQIFKSVSKEHLNSSNHQSNEPKRTELGLKNLNDEELSCFLEFIYLGKIETSSLSILFPLLLFCQEKEETELTNYLIRKVELISRKLHDEHKFEVAFLHFAPDLLKLSKKIQQKFLDFWCTTFKVPRDKLIRLIEESNHRSNLMKKQENGFKNQIEDEQKKFEVNQTNDFNQWEEVIKKKDEIIDNKNQTIQVLFKYIYGLIAALIFILIISLIL